MKFHRSLRQALCGAAALLCLALPIRGQAARLDESPLGRSFATFLETFNRGEDTTARFARWYRLFGPVEPRRVTALGTDRLQVWAWAPTTRAWLGFLVAQSPTATPAITVLTLGGAGPNDTATIGTPVAPSELPAALARYLGTLAERDYFSGVVLVARNGSPVFGEAYGHASKGYDRRNTLNTRFMLGSVTKIFTATAVLQLVQAGRLRLDDSVGTFLPTYPTAPARAITIHQLLSHTSGLGQANLDWIADRSARTLEELVQLTAAPMQAAPGATVAYNNEAWLILGRIIELVSGEPYEQYLAAHIFEPAGMTRSGFQDTGDEVADQATPYTNLRLMGDGSRLWTPDRRAAWQLGNARGTPAGDSWSTAPDLLAFMTALHAGRLLDQRFVGVMLTPHTEPRALPDVQVRLRYGYGTEISDGYGPLRQGKGGGTAGVSTQVVMFPETGYTVVILSNYDSIANIVLSGIATMLPR